MEAFEDTMVKMKIIQIFYEICHATTENTDDFEKENITSKMLGVGSKEEMWQSVVRIT